MEVRHADDKLARIEAEPGYNGGLDNRLVRAFRKVMNIIRTVANEGELYHWKSLHFEKLKGNRSHQRSLRLVHQWRLIMEIENRSGVNNNLCVVIAIEDYH
ncbi:MAG: type II toxin-antitoxin system RelE/ParE family toxin [Candidatus Paceibacterota bacterium]